MGAGEGGGQVCPSFIKIPPRIPVGCRGRLMPSKVQPHLEVVKQGELRTGPRWPGILAAPHAPSWE